MIRTSPKKVASTAFAAAPPTRGATSNCAPVTQAVVLLLRGLSPATTVYAAKDASARRPSESIAPPPTGSASVSMSSCFEDDELLTRLCHPEIAPHAIATNRIGQIGPRIPWGSTQNGPAGIWTEMGGVTNGVASAPMIIRMIAAYAG